MTVSSSIHADDTTDFFAVEHESIHDVQPDNLLLTPLLQYDSQNFREHQLGKCLGREYNKLTYVPGAQCVRGIGHWAVEVGDKVYTQNYRGAGNSPNPGHRTPVTPLKHQDNNNPNKPLGLLLTLR